jgi:hypothetical protein
LPHARAIITESTTVQNITKRGKRKFYVLEAMRQVEEKGNITDRKVRVILLEDDKKGIVFYSVMDKKSRYWKKKKPEGVS